MSASPPRLALHSRPAKGASTVRRIAAIDVGSNSVRQIVADVTAEGSITVVDEMKILRAQTIAIFLFLTIQLRLEMELCVLCQNQD